jgi:hypothetical protein
MSLLGLQAALGQLVRSPALRARAVAEGEQAFDGFEVAASRRAWLARLARTPGFQFTCSIQRSWCELRARSAARLTVTALSPALRQEIIAGWLARGGGTSSFFLTETVAFLEFVATWLEPGSHLESICRMEQAAHRVSAAGPSFVAGRVSSDELLRNARLVQHPAAALVVFRAPPDAVLAAALSGTPLPPPTEVVYPLVFAPGLPRLCRTATRLEASVFDACAPGMAAEDVLALDRSAGEALTELLRIGALEAGR